MVTAVFDRELGLQKEEVIAHLGHRNIDSRPFFSPLSSLPAYRHCGGEAQWKSRNPVSYDIAARAVNLPSGFNMTEALVERVTSALYDVTCANNTRRK
jgi:perosamine synthetase